MHERTNERTNEESRRGTENGRFRGVLVMVNFVWLSIGKAHILFREYVVFGGMNGIDDRRTDERRRTDS